MSAIAADNPKRGRLILYAENDPTDAFLFQRATRQFDHQLDFEIVADGLIAIEWLNGDGPYGDRAAFPLPDMVITDLKMPGRDGFEVLRFVRGHPKLKELPVVIHSSSSLDEDVSRARNLEVTNYIQKDALCDSLVKYLRRYVDALAAADAKLSSPARRSR
jgi:CheY-like chemotaxis protein